MDIGDVVFLKREKKFAIKINKDFISIEQNHYIKINTNELILIKFNNKIIETIKSFAKNGLLSNNYYNLSSAFDLLRNLNIQIENYMKIKK